MVCALSLGAPRTSNAPAFPNIQMMDPSSFGSPSLQTVVTQKHEPILVPSSSQMGTAIYDENSYLTLNESENTKGNSLKGNPHTIYEGLDLH